MSGVAIDCSRAVIIPFPTIVETFLDEKGNKIPQNDKKILVGLSYLLSVIPMIAAAILAWDCNRNESIAFRIIATIAAAVFNILYLLFYLFYRVMYGSRCY